MKWEGEKTIVREYIERVKAIYGRHLKNAILFGSYARGESDGASDIDILLLVDDSAVSKESFEDAVDGLTFEFNVRHDTMISPIIESRREFLYWQDANPFFLNVKQDGVMLYGQAG